MRRYEAMTQIMDAIDNELVVCNIGHPSQELHMIDDRTENFYMLGSMGLAMPIGLGIAMNTDKKVLVIDGDCAITMNMNGLATLGCVSPSNLVHVIIDNEANGSTGFQPGFTSKKLHLDKVAEACGIPNIRLIEKEDDIVPVIKEALAATKGAWVIVIKTDIGMPDGVGPLPLSGLDIKARFVEHLK